MQNCVFMRQKHAGVPYVTHAPRHSASDRLNLMKRCGDERLLYGTHIKFCLV